MARVERSSSGASDVVIRSDTRHATRFTTANPGVSHAESLADVVSIVRNDPSRLIEDEQFQCFMGGVIIVNILVLAGETDYPDLWIWTICNGFILALFTAEVLVKMWRYGFDAYFSGASIAWNVLDAAIVFLGMVELLLAALTGGAGSSCYSSVLRIVRLLRLLRLLRLFRVVKQLMALATAFQSMMASFAVVFAVLFLLLLVSSMLCTQCLGNATEFVSDTGEEEREELVRDIQVHFKDIPTTMFSLFQVTTLDNWIDIAKPAIMVDMRWQGFFVLFICAASWTMISILTAVASESVVESAMGREEAMQKEEQQMQKKFFDFLRKAFLEADADGNGLLDREEFESLIRTEAVIKMMRSSMSALTTDDMMNAWETLDVNRTGELTIEEFVSGFAMLNEGLSTKHIASFDFTLQRTAFDILSRISRLTDELAQLRGGNAKVLERLEEAGGRQGRFVEQLWLWRKWALQQDMNPQTRQALERLEPPPIKS